ncbi:protease modulator HflC [Notoacmeibacter ruber]|uniref:Protease modulator HflC n=1 Tax=Notoacmeibacter ruber TaxID=2670375 RepID=A0A3L7JBN2_9HYPH|nr:protease modulator HflC [Notoacmeibacter ruber]RLQ88147.1 protease modulator HflC [Notoacmeibacter ruber]
MNRFTALLIALAVIVVIALSSIFVVNERQQAIVLRFGEIVDVEEQPGLYFKLPILDSVQLIDDRILRFNLDDIRVQVSGGKFYVVDAFVAYRINDPRRFRQAVSGSVPLAEQRLRTRMDAALRRVYGLRGFEAALSDERTEMMREVASQLRPAAEQLGLEIEDVRIRRTDLTAEVSQQTYDRMTAERLAEAERLRARGREAAQRIRARSDREVVEIRADAQRQSEILRGEGDAERNRIFADSYGEDPEFFDFYRSMQAYAQSLQDTGSTLVLSPDSEFFRYFTQAGGGSLSSVAPVTRQGPELTSGDEGGEVQEQAPVSPDGGTQGDAATPEGPAGGAPSPDQGEAPSVEADDTQDEPEGAVETESSSDAAESETAPAAGN